MLIFSKIVVYQYSLSPFKYSESYLKYFRSTFWYSLVSLHYSASIYILIYARTCIIMVILALSLCLCLSGLSICARSFSICPIVCLPFPPSPSFCAQFRMQKEIELECWEYHKKGARYVRFAGASIMGRTESKKSIAEISLPETPLLKLQLLLLLFLLLMLCCKL